MKRRPLILVLLAVSILVAAAFSIRMWIIAKQHWVGRKLILLNLCSDFHREHGRSPTSVDEMLNSGDPQFRSVYLSDPLRFPYRARERTFSEHEYPIEITGGTLVIGESSGFFGILSIPERRFNIGDSDRSSPRDEHGSGD